MRYTLKKSELLSDKKIFQEVFGNGKRVYGNYIRCIYTKMQGKELAKKSYIKVGFVVSKKLKRATDRNRIKRLMKETYRLNKAILINGIVKVENIIMILVFVYAPTFQSKENIPKYKDIEDDMISLLSVVNKSSQ